MCSHLIKREKLCWFNIAKYCPFEICLTKYYKQLDSHNKINFIENKFLCNLNTWQMERNKNMINCGWTLWEAFSVEFNEGNVLKGIAIAALYKLHYHMASPSSHYILTMHIGWMNCWNSKKKPLSSPPPLFARLREPITRHNQCP